MPFFEAADAIFINYTWKEGTPSQAAAVAGARKHDVYMGVDVFGRNTYGGGGMSCDVALTAARSAGSWPSPTSQILSTRGSGFQPFCSCLKATCTVDLRTMMQPRQEMVTHVDDDA